MKGRKARSNTSLDAASVTGKYRSLISSAPGVHTNGMPRRFCRSCTDLLYGELSKLSFSAIPVILEQSAYNILKM